LAGEITGFLKTMLASAAQGTKKRMAQPVGTGWGPRMPKGSAFCPASRASTWESKSERGGFCADGFGEGAGLAFSEGKIEFSVSQSSVGKGEGRAS
jgi:hypothetical protein